MQFHYLAWFNVYMKKNCGSLGWASKISTVTIKNKMGLQMLFYSISDRNICMRDELGNRLAFRLILPIYNNCIGFGSVGMIEMFSLHKIYVWKKCTLIKSSLWCTFLFPIICFRWFLCTQSVTWSAVSTRESINIHGSGYHVEFSKSGTVQGHFHKKQSWGWRCVEIQSVLTFQRSHWYEMQNGVSRCMSVEIGLLTAPALCVGSPGTWVTQNVTAFSSSGRRDPHTHTYI